MNRYLQRCVILFSNVTIQSANAHFRSPLNNEVSCSESTKQTGWISHLTSLHELYCEVAAWTGVGESTQGEDGWNLADLYLVASFRVQRSSSADSCPTSWVRPVDVIQFMEIIKKQKTTAAVVVCKDMSTPPSPTAQCASSLPWKKQTKQTSSLFVHQQNVFFFFNHFHPLFLINNRKHIHGLHLLHSSGLLVFAGSSNM